MKIILTQSVEKLGNAGDVVEVAKGYGRNYLIPQGFAVLALERNRRQFDHKRSLLERKYRKQLADAKSVAEKIESLSITISKKAGENEKLFGSVTNQDIHAALEKEGLKIDRRDIHLSEPIKALGYVNVPVKVGPETEAQLKVWVVEEK